MSHTETHSRFLALASRITYPGLDIEVVWETVVVKPQTGGAGTVAHCGHYLRVSAPEGSCNVTTQPMCWKGRKWRLSQHMTDFEFVATAFKALITALEHEARELFKVDGVAVMDSHLDLDKLLTFRQETPQATRD